MSEVGELTTILNDSKIRLCLRILSAFSSRADGFATPGEIYNIVWNDGYGRIHYEQVRVLVANFLVPHGFVSRGRAHERKITEKGRTLYNQLGAYVNMPSQVPNRELIAPNSANLVSQIGHLIEGLPKANRLQVLTEALRRFC